MTALRAGVLALVVIAVVAIGYLLLRGPSTTDYVLTFENAGQIVDDNDVQVGGRRVGSVKAIDLTPDNLARITIAVSEEFVPLHEGTSAQIRATSLSGIANRYIALSPGPNNRPELRAGATLGTERTTTPVDLDQLFNTLDAPTRRSLQAFIKGSRTVIDGRETEAREALRYFAPTLSAGSRLANELTRDQAVLSDLIATSSRVTQSLAARRDRLSSLVSNTNEAAGAIAAEESSLDEGLQRLPTTLRRANTTFVNLRASLDDLDDLVDVSKPATRRLAPFLAELRPLVASARPTVADLRRLVRTDGAGNDLTDLLRQAPALDRVAATALPNSTEALEGVLPNFTALRPYAPELTQAFRDFGQVTANYDANGHYARVAGAFNAYSQSGGTLTQRPDGASRLTDLATTKVLRCPGSATQAAADGSNPYRDASGDLQCDASAVRP